MRCKGSKGTNAKNHNFFYFKSNFSTLFKKFISFDEYKKVTLMDFSYWKVKRSQRDQKRYFYRVCRFFIFHAIWKGFYSLDSSLKDLSVVGKRIWGSSYRFRDIRGLKGPTAKIVTFLFLVLFWQTFFNIDLFWGAFSIMPTDLNVSLTFPRYNGLKRTDAQKCNFYFILLYPIKSLWPANYSIKHKICTHS